MTGRQQFAIAAVVIGVAGAIAWSATHYLRKELFPVELGSKAPDFSAYTLDSTRKVKTLADYRGQVLMINVWATWCLPCRVEMPSIEALQQDYARKGLKIVAVSIDDPGTDEAIRNFAKQYKLTFEILHDPNKDIVDAYDITGYPETFIVGRDGIIRKKLMSATDWNSPDSRALMDRLLTERTE
ncbi:MAG TPA: TlpA disulfide reductase family protein [Gemmatimonadaceae bacterium]|jgi:cytochrome c biogenesis protein CcmG, thiol:disulfide interchange protein DsbE|nr:TlpA disulfide reductase family protein [Gemmatimonadaceae bacterium]